MGQLPEDDLWPHLPAATLPPRQAARTPPPQAAPSPSPALERIELPPLEVPEPPAPVPERAMPFPLPPRRGSPFSFAPPVLTPVETPIPSAAKQAGALGPEGAQQVEDTALPELPPLPDSGPEPQGALAAPRQREEELRALLEQREAELARAQGLRQTAEAERDWARGSLEEVQERLRGLAAEREAEAARCKELEAALGVAETGRGGVEAAREALARRVEQLESSLGKAEVALEGSRSEGSFTSSLLEEAQGRIRELEAQVARYAGLEAALEAVQEERSDSEAVRGDLAHRVEELELALRASQSECEGLQAQVAALGATLESALDDGTARERAMRARAEAAEAELRRLMGPRRGQGGG